MIAGPWSLYFQFCIYNDSGVAANVACLLALLVQPYMPAVSQTMMDQLNVKQLWKLEKKFTCLLKQGHKIGSVSLSSVSEFSPVYYCRLCSMGRAQMPLKALYYWKPRLKIMGASCCIEGLHEAPITAAMDND